MINLRSELHLALLGYYFKNPDAEHYLRELSRILSFNNAHLSRELKKLTRYGLFAAHMSGQQKFFRINKNHPLFDEFRLITIRTIEENKKISH
ncbi:MAG: winged helix DNA-binding protein, partial [bacterium]|nr:winged helix DNA-binding protein [bacterium]